MTLFVAIALNAVLVVALLTALAYVCWIPFRLPSAARTGLLAASEADQQDAAERYAA